MRLHCSEWNGAQVGLNASVYHPITSLVENPIGCPVVIDFLDGDGHHNSQLIEVATLPNAQGEYVFSVPAFKHFSVVSISFSMTSPFCAGLQTIISNQN